MESKLGKYKQRVIVTGGAGFIGSNLIKRLLQEGNQVVSLDNYSTGKKENEIEHDNITYHDVDLSDTDNFDFFMDKPDVIYHMAAIARIQPSFEHPLYTFNSNVVATMNILDWAREKKCPVVYAGSSSTHSGIYKNPYTLSKFQGEMLCTMYTKVYGLPISVCRFYNVYGPNQLTEGAYTTLIGAWLKRHEEGKPLKIFGTGEKRRDFTHVDDIVDGLFRCGNSLTDKKRKMAAGMTFEFGRGRNHSVNDVADMFGDYPREYGEDKPGEAETTLCDHMMATDVLGWNPTRNLKDYLEEKING